MLIKLTKNDYGPQMHIFEDKGSNGELKTPLIFNTLIFSFLKTYQSIPRSKKKLMLIKLHNKNLA